MTVSSPSFLTLTTSSFSFTITKAHIRESLESPFSIECEGYIESMQEQLIALGDTPTTHTLDLSTLLDSPASFSIANPYANLESPSQSLDSTLFNPNTDTSDVSHQAHKDTMPTNSTHKQDIHNTLANPTHKADFTPTHSTHTPTHFLKKHYTGIITALQYLGAEYAHQSIQSITTIAYKHFFKITLTSTLKRLDYNQAYRIYTDVSILDIIKTLFMQHTHALAKNIDYTHIYHSYQPQELITQYNESDLSFITRLAHNNGLYFYEDEHTIYVCDTHHNKPPIHIPYNPNPNNTLHQTCIHAFFKQGTLMPSTFSQSHTSNPLDIYTTTSLSSHSSYSNPYASMYHQYHHNAHMSFSQQTNTHIPLALQEQYYTLSKNRLFAKSNAYHLHLGDALSITMPKHYAPPMMQTSQDSNNPQEYIIIALEQVLIDTTSLANTTSIPHTTHHSSTTLTPSATTTNPNHTHNNTLSTLAHDTMSTPATMHNTQKHTSVASTPHTTLSHAIFTPTTSHSPTATTHSPFIRSYSNTLTLLPSHIAFTPQPKAKPTPPTSTQGIVIGEGYIQAKNLREANQSIIKEANTIHTDSYGRVRVRLHSFYAYALSQEALLDTKSQTNSRDIPQSNSTQRSMESSNTHKETQSNHTQYLRESSNIDSLHKDGYEQREHKERSDTSLDNKDWHTTMQSLLTTHTPFLRVASPIASNHSGLYHTPRVGDEVIISYMDNDIDKPYISGSLYNQHNPSLANLPTQDHITALSSKTIGVNEQGSNEITLSNEKDKEVITLKAQKDYTESINHNFSQTIKNNKDSITLGNHTESIHKAHSQNITLTKSVKVGGEYLTNVALSKDTIVGLSNSLNVGASNSLRVGKDSSESIGGDRRVEIGGSSREEIEGDKHQVIKGESQMYVEKSLTQSIQQEMLLDIQQNFSTNVKENLATNAKSMQNNVDEQYSLQADNATLELQSDCSIQAGNSLNFSIGETTITATSDSVIIKAGGVEVIIDSKGLVVKGGEVKSE